MYTLFRLHGNAITIATLRSQTLDEEESLEQLAGVEGAAPGIISGDGSLVQGGKEEVVRREMCDMVQFMDRIPGQLEITTHHLFFHSSERREGHTCECCHGNHRGYWCCHGNHCGNHRGDDRFQGVSGPAEGDSLQEVQHAADSHRDLPH